MKPIGSYVVMRDRITNASVALNLKPDGQTGLLRLTLNHTESRNVY